MQLSELRLECLKLTYTHGRDVAEAVGRAKVLEDYILGTQESAPKKQSAAPKKEAVTQKKNVGNP